jgi:hypothetical protein
VSVALHGNLSDFGIAEVFQLIGQQRKTGLLEIKGEEQAVRLAFDDGAVVWASPVGSTEFAVLGDRLVRCGLITRETLDEVIRESESSARQLPMLLVENGAVAEADIEEISELLSRETIFEVMRWTGGSFHFSAQTIHHSVAPEKLLAAEQILMDGLRMLDEWQTFHAYVPSDDCVFGRTGQLDAYRHKVKNEGGPEAEQVDRVYQLIDGRLTARRVIDLSRLGTFEATRVLAELRKTGVIAPVEDKSPRRSQQRGRPRIALGVALRWTFAMALPLVLLSLLVGAGLQMRRLAAETSELQVVRTPFEDARVRFERLRLQNALEAQRFLTGEWPSDLSDASALAPLGDFVMAPADLPAYYYQAQESGVLLLAPVR